MPKHKHQKNKTQKGKKQVTKKNKATVKTKSNQWLTETNEWLGVTVAIFEIYDRLIKPFIDFCILHWQGWP